jgi:hypothetical protein
MLADKISHFSLRPLRLCGKKVIYLTAEAQSDNEDSEDSEDSENLHLKNS